MSSLHEDEIIEIGNSSKENFAPQAESTSLKTSLKFKISSSLPFSTISKRYPSKFKKELSFDPKYTFLKECKHDSTKVLCIICNIQFSIQNSEITNLNNHMKRKKHQECL